MSSNRKKIIEPWEVVRETCRRDTKIAIFACFCPSKKPLFSLFLQILPFQAEIQENQTVFWMVSTNPIFCTHGLPNWWKNNTLKKRDQRTKKNNVLFCSCDDVIKSEWNQTSPVSSPMWMFFLSKQFSKSVHPFQIYCLKTAITAHRPTL